MSDHSADRLLFEGQYLTLKSRRGWEFVGRKHPVVCLIAWTPARELLLVEQFRIPVDSHTIELPAGLAGDQIGQTDEPLELAASRELEEETGWRPGRLTEIMRCPSTAGLSDEVVVFYLAHELEKTGDGGGDGSEDITVHQIAIGEIDRWLDEQRARGKALDPKIFAALHWTRSRFPSILEE
ncbi:MAG: NUDIX hydrolase [Wenzhouxiangella sp.]